MALAAKIAKDFQNNFAPGQQSRLIKDHFDVLSDEDPAEGENNQLNVIVATKIIEDKSKEAGLHTVKPLLSIDSPEELKSVED